MRDVRFTRRWFGRSAHTRVGRQGGPLLLCGVVLACAIGRVTADEPSVEPADEAVFFDDAFAELRGERPDDGVRPTVGAATDNRSLVDATRWSAWVDAGVLESEIKRQASALAAATANPAKHRLDLRAASDARGLVALLFAVTAEHDGAPRWGDAATRLRDHFALGPDSESRQATDETYEGDKLRADDLADLVRGGRPDVPAAPANGGEVDWGSLASRGAVMRRMMQAEEPRLVVWLADRRTFVRQADQVQHEAQVLALLAEATHRPGAADADDEGYKAYAVRLRNASVDLDEAAASEDYPRAQGALQEVIRTCADCHEDYRG